MSRLYNILNDITGKLATKTKIVRERATLTSSVTISAGGFSQQNYTVNKAGYYPLGIVGYCVSYVQGDTFRNVIYNISLNSASDGSASVALYIGNTSSAQVKVKIEVDILWLKI